jgi:hypothetical protein
VESLLHGNTPFWLWWHLISSTITTVAIGSLFFLCKQFATRDVQLVALGLALMTGGSALGFLYTRDRISVLVGIGYAVLLYVALAALWKRGGEPPARTIRHRSGDRRTGRHVDRSSRRDVVARP